MSQQPIDAVKIVLRTLRLFDDARKAAETSWQRFTGPAKDTAPSDRRRPPQIW
jgi:hypothetical protein